MELNPKLKVFTGAHQCGWCIKKRKDAGLQQSGVQRIPCLSSGGGLPCIPCSLRRQRCSFKTGGRSTNTVASRPAEGSGAEDVLTLKPYAHRVLALPTATSTSAPRIDSPVKARVTVPQALSHIPSAKAGLQSGSTDEITRSRRKFTRKLKSSVEFLGENLRGIHPDTGPAAADLLDTLQEVRDELVERLEDTDDLLKQIRDLKI